MISIPKTYNVAGIAAIMSIGGFVLGMDYSSLTTFLSTPQFVDYFGQVGSMAQGLIIAANPIGAFAGCILCGSFCDSFGCIKTLQIACVVWMGGSLVSMFVLNIEMLTTGRLLKGIAMGILSAITPVYISETVPSGKKGSAMSIIQWSSTWGTLSMCFVSYGCSYIQGDMMFRIAWGMEIIPSIIFLVACFFLPESPKWLASHSRWLEAAKILDRLRNPIRKKSKDKYMKSDLDIEESSVKVVSGDMDYVLDAFTSGNNVKSCTYADLFGKHLWKYTLIGTSTQMMGQLTGNNILMYLFVYICGMCGLEGNMKTLTTSMQYVVVVIFTFFPILLLDGCRRKDALVFGTFILGLSHAALCGLMAYCGYEPLFVNFNLNSPFSWRIEGEMASVVLSICFYFVAIYASTISCVAWLYTGEIFPMRAKAKGSSVCMGVSWVFNASLTLVSPLLFSFAKYWTFAIFSFFCFAGCLVMIFKFPETRSLSDLEVEALYQSNSAFNKPRHRREDNNSASLEYLEGRKMNSNPLVSPERKDDKFSNRTIYNTGSQPKIVNDVSGITKPHSLQSNVGKDFKQERKSFETYRSEKSEVSNRTQDSFSHLAQLQKLKQQKPKQQPELQLQQKLKQSQQHQSQQHQSQQHQNQHQHQHQQHHGSNKHKQQQLKDNRNEKPLNRQKKNKDSTEKAEIDPKLGGHSENKTQNKNLLDNSKKRKSSEGATKRNTEKANIEESDSESSTFFSDTSSDEQSLHEENRYNQVMDYYTASVSSGDEKNGEAVKHESERIVREEQENSYNQKIDESDDSQFDAKMDSESSDGEIFFVKDSPTKSGLTYEPSGFLTGGQNSLPVNNFNRKLPSNSREDRNTKTQSHSRSDIAKGVSKVASGENKLNSGGRKKRAKSKWS